MKIYIISGSSFPEGMASTKRIYCYGKGLVNEGHRVKILLYHRVFEPEAKDRWPKQGNINGIDFNYVSGEKKHRNRLLRGLDYFLLDKIRLYFYTLSHLHKGDVVHCYFLDNLMFIIMLIIVRIKGAKITRELCEVPYYDLKPSHKRSRWFEEFFLMQHYDGFVAISHTLENYAIAHKGKSAKVVRVPILCDKRDDVDPQPSKYSVPYIVHTGTMFEQKDGISIILKAFAEFKKNDKLGCRLVFTGPHANEKSTFIPLMEKLGIRDYVDLLGLISTSELYGLQQNAALSIIYKRENMQTNYCFPTKLGEMLMSGVPVVATSVGEAKYFLKNKETAFIVSLDNISELASTIDEIIKNRDFAKTIGSNGKALALREFSPIVQGRALSDFFVSLDV